MDRGVGVIIWVGRWDRVLGGNHTSCDTALEEGEDVFGGVEADFGADAGPEGGEPLGGLTSCQ